MIPKAERKRCAWPADLNRLITFSEAQREAKVEPDAMTDDFGGEAMAAVTSYGGAHQRIMPHEHSSFTIC
jgi:hypothetical protein